MVDMVEFAGQCKLAFRGQSYVFVAYNAVLPLMLLVSRFPFFPPSIFDDDPRVSPSIWAPKVLLPATMGLVDRFIAVQHTVVYTHTHTYT